MSKWDLVKLSEVLNYEQPTKYIVETTNYNDKHNIPVLTAGKSFLLGYTNEKTGIFPEKKLPIIIFDDFTTASKLVDFPFKVKSSAMKMLHSKNVNVDIKYVFYAMQNIHFSPEEHKRFWISKYSNFKIPFPPLAEQQKIASFLTRIEALIQKREESIQLLDELIKSTFLDMFGDPVLNPKGWEKETIEKIVKKEKHAIKRGPFGGALKKEIFVDDGYLVYEQYHALNNDFSMARYFINEKKFEELKAFIVKENDIIISCSGVYLGKLAVVPKGARQGIINQALLKISLDERKMKNIMFLHIFRNKNFRNSFLGNQRGAGIPNFPPMTKFKKVQFILPPQPLQDKFASLVTKIESTKARYQSSLDELNNLFNSTAQKAFKGELNLGNIEVIEKEISKEEAQVLDEDKILELIQSGSFEAKDHVSEKQSYDDIRDMVLNLMDNGKITQKFTDDKKMVLEAIN